MVAGDLFQSARACQVFVLPEEDGQNYFDFGYQLSSAVTTEMVIKQETCTGEKANPRGSLLGGVNYGGRGEKQPAQCLLSEKDDFLSLFIN